MVIFTRFQPSNFDLKELEYVQKVLERYFYGFFICRTSGSLLYSWQVSSELKLNLISQFISALSMFGEENLGKIKRILIEGLDVEISVTAKHDLICAALFHADMVKDHLDQEGEHILDVFAQKYAGALDENRCNSAIYANFDSVFWDFIVNYLERIGILSDGPAFSDYSQEITEISLK